MSEVRAHYPDYINVLFPYWTSAIEPWIGPVIDQGQLEPMTPDQCLISFCSYLNVRLKIGILKDVFFSLKFFERDMHAYPTPLGKTPPPQLISFSIFPLQIFLEKQMSLSSLIIRTKSLP